MSKIKIINDRDSTLFIYRYMPTFVRSDHRCSQAWKEEKAKTTRILFLSFFLPPSSTMLFLEKRCDARPRDQHVGTSVEWRFGTAWQSRSRRTRNDSRYGRTTEKKKRAEIRIINKKGKEITRRITPSVEMSKWRRQENNGTIWTSVVRQTRAILLLFFY